MSALFAPLQLRGLTLANRIMVAPMCQYSAVDGEANDWHFTHINSLALSGAALFCIEATHVEAIGRITPGCLGLWNDATEAALKPIVASVRKHSKIAVAMQLAHAGRKGSSHTPWDGGQQIALVEGGWQTEGPSALPHKPGELAPLALDAAGLVRIRDAFASAAKRAARLGLDALELHCAHGYLLHQFLSPIANQRSDRYGGTLQNRLRFPLEVFEALREVWPAGKPMSVRISATDWAEGGITGDDAVEIARAFARAGVDLVDVSTGQTVRDAQPVYGRMFQTPFSEQVRNEARVATMCVGNITTSDQVNTILAAGRADLVALGRPHLVDSSFTMKAAAWYGAEISCPPQYLPGKEQIFRNSVRDRQDFEDLKIKAKPKTRAELKSETTKPLAAE